MEAVFSYGTVFAELPLIKAMNFTAEELQKLTKEMKWQQYKKGAVLLQANEEENHIRFIQKGVIRQYYIHQGKEYNTQFSACCDVVCSVASYMTQEPSQYAIEAVEPTTAFSFEREAMNRVVLSGGLRMMEFGRKIFSIIFNEKALRERELVNDDALARLQNFLTNKPNLFAALPQKHIASYLNITPETFSNLKRKLKYPA
jgi:CRP/FNR family transcriptional regulator, anaerobic regulatory protein